MKKLLLIISLLVIGCNGNVIDYEIIPLTQVEIDGEVIKLAKDDFKNNLEGVFAIATTPDGLNEYAIKIGNDGKITTVLIP